MFIVSVWHKYGGCTWSCLPLFLCYSFLFLHLFLFSLLRLLYTRRGPSPVHRCHHFSLFLFGQFKKKKKKKKKKFSACSPRIRVRMCMREELITSFFGTASCMSCFGYFVPWPGLFRFGAAETSFRGILLNDRWVDQLPLIHLLVLTLSFRKSVLILGRNAINNGKVDRISFLNFAFLLPSCEASFYGILDDRWSLSWPVSFNSFAYVHPFIYGNVCWFYSDLDPFLSLCPCLQCAKNASSPSWR